jgi:hypothetical protein
VTTEQRRAHYDEFVAEIIGLCAVTGVRADLASGRGRPVEQCERMQRYLAARTARFGARRAHYTVASLIALQPDLARHGGSYTPELPHPVPGGMPGGPRPPAPAAAIGGGLSGPPAAAGASPGDDDPVPDGKTAGLPWRGRPSLGTSLALAVIRHGFKQHRMDDRLRTLTRLPAALLHPRLVPLAAHLYGRGAGRLDFAVLLEDLAWWDYDRLDIAARWREHYFLTLDRLTLRQD